MEEQCIIVFGKSGVGKSTLLNVILGVNIDNYLNADQKFDVGKNSLTVTTVCKCITKNNYKCIDTPGLDTIQTDDKKIGDIVKHINIPIHYAIFVTECGRINSLDDKCWKIFCKIFDKMPEKNIKIVITGTNAKDWVNREEKNIYERFKNKNIQIIPFGYPEISTNKIIEKFNDEIRNESTTKLFEQLSIVDKINPFVANITNSIMYNNINHDKSNSLGQIISVSKIILKKLWTNKKFIAYSVTVIYFLKCKELIFDKIYHIFLF